ncbi:hypothetical protein V2K24_04050 [Pseudomonas alliivorans]|nr:hypothetical protein [Pseudomonas alliivorans]
MSNLSLCIERVVDMSGRKIGKGRGKQATPKIPRDDYVYGTTDGVVSTLTVAFHSTTGTLSITEADPSTITRKITHKRTGKDDKIIYSAPADEFSLSLSHFEELKKRFDYLLAVDTNTLTKPSFLKGCSLSATSIYCIIESIQTLTTRISYVHLASYVILDTNTQAKHESLGWHLAIKHHIDTPFLRTQRIGIIVDSELGKHIDINSRKTPYHAGFCLPANVSLLYASCDKAEMFANSMIRYCDAAATKVLEEFERLGIDGLVEKGAPVDGTAKWFFLKAR